MATSSPPSSSSSPPSSSSSSTFDSSSHTLVTPDLSLHYDLHGSPSAEEKLFLIMGLLTDGAAWAYQVDYFARRGFQVVTYDNRGVAQSSTPKNPLSYTTTQMADDAVRLANHLGWEKFHLVGVSMGGMIALELCLQVPFTRIASLTLIVTHAGGWGGIAPFVGVRRMAKSIFTTDKKRKLDTLMRLLYSEETLKDSELANKLRGHHESRLATAIPPKLPAILGHTLAVYRHFVSYPNLLRIRYAPFTTLIVVGSEDQLVRRSNSFMLGRVLGARVYEVQHGGHGLLAQYPDQINEEMMKHFKGKNAGKPVEGNGSSPDEDDESGNYTVESQEALMDGDDESSSNEDTSSRPYTLEEHALSLFCKHSVHCSIHNLSGFLTGFIPGFIFRWIFYDSIALSSPTHPVSRLDQSVRFGLLVGVVRSSIRALRCIWHAHRARQWIKKHSLRQTETPRNNNPSELRKGIPPGAGFNFPSHSILLLCAFAFITWQQRLLAGIF